MREEIERILETFMYEMNTPETRFHIKNVLSRYMEQKVMDRTITDYNVEDRTLYHNMDNGIMHFQLYYQPVNVPQMVAIDIGIRPNSSIDVSGFENNVVGERNLKKLKF